LSSPLVAGGIPARRDRVSVGGRVKCRTTAATHSIGFLARASEREIRCLVKEDPNAIQWDRLAHGALRANLPPPQDADLPLPTRGEFLVGSPREVGNRENDGLPPRGPGQCAARPGRLCAPLLSSAQTCVFFPRIEDHRRTEIALSLVIGAAARRTRVAASESSTRQDEHEWTHRSCGTSPCPTSSSSAP
jgi:hypothetical protein